MKRRMISGWAAITALGLLTGTAGADDPGVVRISDMPTATPVSATTTTVVNNGVPGADANCDGAGGHWWNSGCHCCMAGHYCPTEGFRPIQTAPINRDAIVYNQYWPAKFYGQPGFNLRPVFPQVYMPTDTTQLGVYYARVPQWMPNPAMYPPPPVPADWHRRVVYVGPASGGTVGAELGPSGVMPTPSQSTPTSPGLVPAPQVAPPAQMPDTSPSAPAPGAAPAPPAAPEPPSASTGTAGQPVTLTPTPTNQ